MLSLTNKQIVKIFNNENYKNNLIKLAININDKR